MKVLGINGSPRKGGNSDILLDKALEGARANGFDIEKIVLSDLNISPCVEEEYENINEQGLSIINDDIHIIYRKIDESDALILASPIFFGSLSAQAKIMIDRFQCAWVAKQVLKKEVFNTKKIGAFISVAGSAREDFFNNARSIVKHFFAIINVDYKDELFCPNVDKKGEVLEHEDYLQRAFEIGERIITV